jgi:predicted ribosome quality control (RQC) complex YloA/Tae2 family protein
MVSKPRKSLNGLDIYSLLDEIRGEVEGRWIQNIYGRGERWEIALQGKSLWLDLKGWICTGDRIWERPEKPSQFCTFLRKNLVGKLETLEQRDRDRAIRLGVRDRWLIIELFRKGNLILTDRGEKVLGSLRKVQRWDIAPPEISRIGEVMEERKRDLVRALAVDYGLGGLYAEELCVRSGLRKDLTSLGDEGKKRLADELEKILRELKGERRPRIVLSKEGAIDVVPIEMEFYRGYKFDPFESFNESIVSYLSRISAEKIPEVVQKEERILSMQRETLEKLEEEAKKIRAACDWIYSNYQKAEQLSEVELEGYVVKLDPSKSLEGNISSLYELAKQKEGKAERVREAMARKKGEKKARRELFKEEKRWWFEKFRWGVTSEGLLMIGGRDARSNDSLVKKHLKEDDVYAHAEVKGAPSVLLKEGQKATDRSKREACHFALIFSKAWKMGRPARAYWVEADQVSKTPPSGEFLPRGSFMISGKKNFVDDLELLADVGWIEYRGEKRLVCSPPGILKSYVRIEPDEERKRRELVKDLSKRFEVHPDVVDSLLPGGGRVLEVKG